MVKMKEIIIPKEDDPREAHELEGYVKSSNGFIDKVRELDEKECVQCGKTLIKEPDGKKGIKGLINKFKELTNESQCDFIIEDEDGNLVGLCSYQCLREYLADRGKKSW